MKPTKTHAPRRRGDELGADFPADPYRAKGKHASPAVCPDCRAVYQRGRWVWGEAPEKAAAHVCPACLRIRERQPAGYVYVGGSFAAEHREELLRLLRNEEEEEKSRHPLQRIMQIGDGENGLEVTTTDVHLARRLGEALHGAFQGKLEIQRPSGEYLVRAYWQR